MQRAADWALARAIATEQGLEEHWVHAIANIALAHAREASGDRPAARTKAERALRIVRRGPGRLETALALVTVARLVPERARQSMAEAQQTIASCPDPGFVRVHPRVRRHRGRRPVASRWRPRARGAALAVHSADHARDRQ